MLTLTLFLDLSSPVGSRPHTPKSDTECEYAERKAAAASDAELLEQWTWGELPASSKRPAQEVVSQADQSDPDMQSKATSVSGEPTLSVIRVCVCCLGLALSR